METSACESRGLFCKIIRNFAVVKRLVVLLFAIVLTVGLRPVTAQTLDADTLYAPTEIDTVKFEVRQLIVPASMITAGALFVGIEPFKQARTWVNETIGVHKCSPTDDILQYLPMASYLFLDFAGVESRRSFTDRVIVGATATILLTATTQSVKYIVNEPRPDGGQHSFPSGHTATAFMGAELLRQDYGAWVGAAGYVVATGVGVMRILNGRHWINDVVAGAGIGILCAKAGEWLLPFNRRWLGLDRPGSAVALLPTYVPSERYVALNAAIIF